ncbi:septal ring lytic transglycosylase RlpA family protein [Marinobacterium rhizophilum]|uniref:Endolytic peptidoglycan transglycosylase RlpA n=1 Tax=Marinobacterium rhizophilum TaxID=420402 RepID=A0ABY5HPQ6_9GAMM|nr:septal ring lytic transglycosylase RlpA family protein [Marinobacterium rhizophilum]
MLLALLAGCSSSVKQTEDSATETRVPEANAGRYAMKHDKAPLVMVDVSKVPDAVPRLEPKSLRGNRSPYEVLGQRYHILEEARGYKEQGTASWYGRKFHGYETSNGEIYDMFSMTAAHKSLPLPSYVRVTNMDNGRQVVVRVNDRGPFHEGRVIDLSYAAASRLDMMGEGTARVSLEVLDPRATQASSPAAGGKAGAAPGRYLQLGAFSDRTAIERIEQRVGQRSDGLSLRVSPVSQEGRTLYRVQLGPVPDSETEARLMRELADAGYTAARPVDLP